ncbi:MAG: hypothetical protein PHU06_02605 [Gallionella sp.]|nr:hypothetical protein [Gallionella sp.]MDD4958290.1 hypothetical protein [Gallionella sp.]
MPYYIYQITAQPIKMLKKLEQHDSYRDSSARVKQLRAELDQNSPATIKMIYADSEFQAEDLLNEIRAAAPQLGDD